MIAPRSALYPTSVFARGLLRWAACVALAVVPLSAVHAQSGSSLINPTEQWAEQKRLCDEGDTVGCLNLGVWLATGDGGPQDTVEARRVLLRACNAAPGNRDKYANWPKYQGCFNLAVMYYHGEGGAVDLATARRYSDIACRKGGVEQGCEMAGFMYLYGEGGAVDKQAAADFLWNTCLSSSLPRSEKACVEYGRMAKAGEGGATNPINLIQIGCKNSIERNKGGEACYELGLLFEDPKQYGPRLADARNSFWDACRLGFAEGCNKLGAMFKKGEGGNIDLPGARRLFQRACDGGVADACEAVKLLPE